MENINIPDGLPTLSRGAHTAHEGKACIMEYVALLAGEAWTDTPTCTYRPLARAAQYVNDMLRDQDRHLLVPLIGRLFGTTEPINDRRFAVFAVRSVIPMVRAVEHLHPVVKSTLDETERALALIEHGEYADAANAAYAAAYAANAAAAAYAAYAAAAAAYAYAAYAAANAAAYAYAANAAANAPGRVAWLSSLIDEYDRLAGRTTHRTVSDDELRSLAATVEAGAR